MIPEPEIPESVKRGIERVRRGELVLIYDAEDREGETDFVMPAITVSPKDIAYFRREAGGLICVAIHPVAADKFGLPLISDILRHSPLSGLVEGKGDLVYDKRSSFSLWVNHRDTFTGITDRDRALTINKIGEAVAEVLNGGSFNFQSSFRTPGHVAILRAADSLLAERRGQTELSVALALLAGIPPAMVICEMLDGDTGYAVSKADARSYAERHHSVFIEGREIVEGYSILLNKS